MGKSIRSKRKKHLRTIKRQALGPIEQAKIAHLNAKLNAYVEKQVEEETGIKVEDRMKDVPMPVVVSHPPTVSSVIRECTIISSTGDRPPPSFVHSHPKPRDPADPLNRPYPRGRPAIRRTGRDRSVKPVTSSAAAPDGATPTASASASTSSDEIVVDDDHPMNAETSDITDARPNTRRRSRSRKHLLLKGESVLSLSEDGVFDADDPDDLGHSVSYIRAPHIRRHKVRRTHVHRSISRKRGKIGAILANWHRIAGQGHN